MLRVLIVEPAGSARVALRNALKDLGVPACLEALDVPGAFQLLSERRVDVIIAAMDMPGEDGIVLTRKIRRGDSPATDPALPIILVVAEAVPQRLFAARDAGISELIAAPIQGKALAARLNAAIRKPRPFVRCAVYVGPDRRRAAKEGYKGPFRREEDWHAKIGR
jgi:two-component system, chemotaxis family, chemotaxis protein CheY